MQNYAVVLYPDKKGLIRLMNLMSGSLMVDYGIKPHITLSVFGSRSELAAKWAYKRLAPLLRPAKLYYHDVLLSGKDVLYAESKRSENLNHDLRVTDETLFQYFGFARVTSEISLDDWAALTAVAYSVERFDMFMYSRYIARVFKPFDCVANSAALVRLDPFTELYVTKLRRTD